MDLILYRNNSVSNKINKNLTTVATYQAVQLTEATDDHDISIRMTVATDVTRWDEVNYFEFDDAYYFLTSRELDHNGDTIIHGSMDLLMTFRAEIGNLKVLALRSTSHGSPRLADAARSFSVDAERSVLPFPNPIPDQEVDGFYVLTTSQPGLLMAP